MILYVWLSRKITCEKNPLEQSTFFSCYNQLTYWSLRNSEYKQEKNVGNRYWGFFSGFKSSRLDQGILIVTLYNYLSILDWTLVIRLLVQLHLNNLILWNKMYQILTQCHLSSTVEVGRLQAEKTNA